MHAFRNPQMNAIIFDRATIVSRYRCRGTWLRQLSNLTLRLYCANRALAVSDRCREIRQRYAENAAMQVAYRTNQFPVMTYGYVKNARHNPLPAFHFFKYTTASRTDQSTVRDFYLFINGKKVPLVQII